MSYNNNYYNNRIIFLLYYSGCLIELNKVQAYGGYVDSCRMHMPHNYVAHIQSMHILQLIEKTIDDCLQITLEGCK